MGEVFKAKREKRNVSLIDFAREVGISPGYLPQLENGKKVNRKLEVILRIIKSLEFDLDILLGLDQESETPALRIPSLIRLVIARDRNMRALEDKEVQKKVSSLLDRTLDTSVYGVC